MTSPRVLIVVALLLLSAACARDDGADVRTIGGGGGSPTGTGTATGSPTGAATGSPTAAATGSPTGAGTATATGTATGVAECEPVGDPASADQEVAVQLDEWSIVPETSSVEAGTITFVAGNAGEEPHELVIVRGDDPAELPLTEQGAVDEEAIADREVGEIEPFPAGTTCEGTFHLEPGSYILLCNIVEEEPDGTVESHFREGMFTTFEVTG
ncbi:MAG: hypothetical protein M3N51_09045 [Actinomycetota bacterium]|nr:hypothetical protein [Actinomycetota bacterium]